MDFFLRVTAIPAETLTPSQKQRRTESVAPDVRINTKTEESLAPQGGDWT